MEAYTRYTAAVDGSPRGKTTGALFDFDGTIVATHSIRELFIERLKAGDVRRQELIDLGGLLVRYTMKSANFVDTMASSIRNLAGTREKDFAALCEKVFTERLASQVFPEVRAIVRAHQRRGHTVAIVSSATPYQVAPVAKALDIEHLLCTELAVAKGRFNGEIDGSPCYGDGKVAAARRFAKAQGIRLRKSFFYSDGAEDLPLLEKVGHPVVINPDKGLADEAARRGWTAHRLDSRGSIGVGDIARTIATFGSVLGFLAAGLPLQAIGASRRDATNFSIATWASVASAIARLKLIVDGEQHLWSHRPAVFLFNHQSAIDVLITARLLREDIVGIAKKEIQRQPFMGPALRFAGAVFIDRANVRDPKAALAPAVEAIGEGRNVVIAPEGTRSRDGHLGAFRKGAFHLARQAGVPLVPIVIHNAMDALPNKSLVVRPAEVKVTVGKPVSTEGWTLRDVTAQADAMRDYYLATLGQADADTAS